MPSVVPQPMEGAADAADQIAGCAEGTERPAA
jgi:hypothetical protein